MTARPTGADIPRAWIDDANTAWDREARSYGPDDDGADETDEFELPPAEADSDIPF